MFFLNKGTILGSVVQASDAQLRTVFQRQKRKIDGSIRGDAESHGTK